MADNSNTTIGGDVKNKKLKGSHTVSADVLLSDENCRKGLEITLKKPKEIKSETDTLNEMLNDVINKSSPLSIRSLRKVPSYATTPRNVTIKKEIITIGKTTEKPLSKLSAYNPTPVKPAKPLNVQISESNSDIGGNQVAEKNTNDGNIIRLTNKDLSMEERKKLRAKRFNLIVAEPSHDDEKTFTRMNRVDDRTAILSNNPTPTFNTLKKRAERFGENVSSVMKSLEQKEKLLKRKLKFLESVTNLKELELKKERAERFRVV